MSTIRFSASGFSLNTTGAFTVSLGGTPSVGDQVVVWIGVNNEIVTHQPNYNNPTQWSQVGALRSRNTSTLSAYQHTWTAADSGSSVNFSVSPAPTLGVGDKDLSKANILWAAAVLQGPVAAAEQTVAGSYDPSGTVTHGPLHKAHSTLLVAAYGLSCYQVADSDGAATLVTSIEDGSEALSVYSVASTAAGYSSIMTAQNYVALTQNSLFTSTNNWTPHGGTLTLVTSPVYGTYQTSGYITPDGVSGQAFIESSMASISPSTSYTATALMYSVSGHTAATSINWFDSGGIYITTDSGPATSIGTATWGRVSFTATSPSNAFFATLTPIIYSSPATSDQVALTEAYLTQTNAQFVTALTDVLSQSVAFNDNPTFLYNPGIIAEGPVSEDALLYRYTLNRYYTLFNNSGTFSMQRYTTTDQLAAATQTFTNNSPVSSTDRTNILNSGVGGEFISA